ncbi:MULTISPECIES: metal ABC transporter permease [Paenibacillus]|uniref:Metal ABC transporter permease n=4 Tax=Paenibacillus TaxID=44249 RepID=A0ABW3DHI1_9BACL|nr:MULTISPECIES: metal ABC transporter permease [Paenibacillus]
MILNGMVIALVGMLSGLVASYELGTPPGASITLILMLIFSVITLAKYMLDYLKLDRLFNKSQV